MKNLGIFLILFSMASLNLGFAGTDGPKKAKANAKTEKMEDTSYHSLGTQIQGHVKYPAFLMKMESQGSSKVTFKVNADQTISVVGVTGSNNMINGYVKQQLQNKSVVVPENQLGKTYEVTINFYLI